MIKILIADDNIPLTQVLIEVFNSEPELQIVKVVHDGLSVIKFLKNSKIDVLILDLGLPYLDGIGVLEKINSILKDKPIIIVYTAMDKESIACKLKKFQIDYLISKPSDPNLLVNKIKELYSYKEDKEKYYKMRIHSLLEFLSTPDVKAKQYIEECLLLALICDKPIIIKEIYKKVAKKHNINYRTAQLTMQKVVNTIWNINKSKFKNTFGYNIYQSSPPSVKEFIMMSVDYIQKKKLY